MVAIRTIVTYVAAAGAAFAAPAEKLSEPAENLDTSILLQRKEVRPVPKAEAEPYLIGLRRESVPIYRRGKIASFKTSYSGVLSVGTPAQHFRVVFDTGSGNIVLPAAECKSEACLVPGRRRFDMRRSSTSVAINTDGSVVRPGEMSDQVTIGFGTGEITGESTRERVCFGTPAAHHALQAAEAAADAAAEAAEQAANASANVSANATGATAAAPLAEAAASAEAVAPAAGDDVQALVEAGGVAPDEAAEGSSEQELCVEMSVLLAVEMSTQPFKTFRFDGILGLGLDGLAMSSNFSAFMSLFTQGTVPAARFGVFLTEGEDGEESEIAMGGYDPRRLLEPLSYAPVVMPEYGYWQVKILAVRVNGVELDVCKDGTCRGVVDTGTSHLGIPAPADKEVGELLNVDAGDLLDCRLADAPSLEFDLLGYTLKLGAANYMRRLPLREDVTVSSPNGVFIPLNDTNSSAQTQAHREYVQTGLNEYCPEGGDLTTEDECMMAATKLGLMYARNWEGPGDHRYCLLAEDGRNAVFFNVAGAAAAEKPPNPSYRSLCAKATEAQAPAAPAVPATVEVPAEGNETVKRFCRPRLMPVRLPAPLGPKLFILGEPVLHRYYTVYDAGSHSVGFALANNRRNTMDPASIVDKRGTLPKEVDMLLMQKGVSVQDVSRVTGQPGFDGDRDDDMTILVQVTMRVSVKAKPCRRV